jgi:hypothetical protein
MVSRRPRSPIWPNKMSTDAERASHAQNGMARHGCRDELSSHAASDFGEKHRSAASTPNMSICHHPHLTREPDMKYRIIKTINMNHGTFAQIKLAYRLCASRPPDVDEHERSEASRANLYD